MNRRLVLGIMLMCHGVWRLYPTLFTCGLAWSMSLIWVIVFLNQVTGLSERSAVMCGSVGLLSNAIVTLANGGMMPVLMPSTGSYEWSSAGPWVPARTDHVFLILADRMDWFGLSVGDGFLIAAPLFAGLIYVAGKVRATLTPAPARGEER